MFTIQPIGYFHSIQKDKYVVPRQANLANNEGVITLNSHCQFEQALEGLEGFDRIWILFRFHRNTDWKPKVLPPRGKKKRGVFATRSPHRPNFIGFSCIELKEIKGLKLFIVNHDLIDGTPILDIKPYLNYTDSFISARQGWLEEIEPSLTFLVSWSFQAQRQLNYLQNQGNLNLETPTVFRLQSDPFPYPNRRIKALENNQYELAYKSWRILYEVIGNQVQVIEIKSGYDQETLKGEKSSRWADVPLHSAFNQNFLIS
jgi:tRNA-Thr(GGU) m(6)t(6)A37 methyltransferase TsaA